MTATLAPPFPTKYWADPFGDWPQWRKDMGLGPHRGLDMNGLPAGTPIPASGTGVAVAEGWSDVLGWWVVVRYAVPGGEIYLGYCHLQSRTTLRYGVWVKLGDTVGFLGSSGSATTGVHLHLTASWSAGNPGTVVVVDPAQFFNTTIVVIDIKETLMQLVWSTNGTGYLVTQDGFHGLPSPQVYNLFWRLINSRQDLSPFRGSGNPETFNQAEVDIMNSQLRLLRTGNQVGTQIDSVKLASAIVDELRKNGVPVTIENLKDVNFEVDQAVLAAAFEAAVPRVSAAIVKQAGQLLAAS